MAMRRTIKIMKVRGPSCVFNSLTYSLTFSLTFSLNFSLTFSLRYQARIHPHYVSRGRGSSCNVCHYFGCLYLGFVFGLYLDWCSQLQVQEDQEPGTEGGPWNRQQWNNDGKSFLIVVETLVVEGTHKDFYRRGFPQKNIWEKYFRRRFPFSVFRFNQF